jgi:hypothetical protein
VHVTIPRRAFVEKRTRDTSRLRSPLGSLTYSTLSSSLKVVVRIVLVVGHVFKSIFIYTPLQPTPYGYHVFIPLFKPRTFNRLVFDLATKMSLRAFTVFQDAPSGEQLRAEVTRPNPMATRSLTNSNVASSNTSATTSTPDLDKENFDPLTGERAGPGW